MSMMTTTTASAGAATAPLAPRPPRALAIELDDCSDTMGFFCAKFSKVASVADCPMVCSSSSSSFASSSSPSSGATLTGPRIPDE